MFSNNMMIGGISHFRAAAGAAVTHFTFNQISGTGAARSIVTEQNLSAGAMALIKNATDVGDNALFDTVRGATKYLSTHNTYTHTTNAQTLTAFNSDGLSLGTDNLVNGSGDADLVFSWLVSAGFFDVVEYTGNGSTQNVTHNLGVAPSMYFIAAYSGGASLRWAYHSALGGTKYVTLESAGASGVTDVWDNTAPTDSVFSLGANSNSNASSKDYMAYLFADKAGVSKAGSYTGDGTTSNAISGLGFEPRVVLTKRADGTGAWRLFYPDGSATQTNYVTLNTTAAAVTSDHLARDSDGFTLTAADADINASGGEYIYFAWA